MEVNVNASIYFGDGVKREAVGLYALPDFDAENDDCLLSPVYYQEWDEQYKNCPLIEKRQPNPFDSVVQLLLDFDLGSEWGGDVKELAQYICDLFKDGAYD